MSLAAIILSAGASLRMGSPKALLRVGGETFADRLIRVFSAAGASPILLVLGRNREDILPRLKRSGEVQAVSNPNPELGQLSSLQAGLLALPASVSGTMFCPVDIPLCSLETVQSIAREFSANESRSPLILPRYRGKRGHPVCIHVSLFSEFLALNPRAQARDVIRKQESRIHYLDVGDPGILRDFDTPEDYWEIQAGFTP